MRKRPSSPSQRGYNYFVQPGPHDVCVWSVPSLYYGVLPLGERFQHRQPARGDSNYSLLRALLYPANQTASHSHRLIRPAIISLFSLDVVTRGDSF